MSRSLDRRAFLGTVAALGTGSLLAACGGGDAPAPAADAPAADAPTPDAPAAAPADVVAAECEGYAELSEQDLTLRESLGYVDVSPNEGELCSNCQFKEDYEADPTCLGCTLFPGPVAPNGYCQSWFAEGAA